MCCIARVDRYTVKPRYNEVASERNELRYIKEFVKSRLTQNTVVN